jgi:hypothetical protein
MSDVDLVAVNSVLRLGPINALTLSSSPIIGIAQECASSSIDTHNERLYTLPLDAAVSVVSHLARLNSS